MRGSGGRDFREAQGQERLTGNTQELRAGAIDDGKDLGFAAARAGRGGTRGVGVGRQGESFLRFAHLGGFKFKGRIAIVADVVEATTGLAGIEDILGAALRAGNGNRREPHRPPAWRTGAEGVKRARGSPNPSITAGDVGGRLAVPFLRAVVLRVGQALPLHRREISAAGHDSGGNRSHLFNEDIVQGRFD